MQRKVKDAVGEDMIIGRLYGFSRKKDGCRFYRVGRLDKINTKTVTFSVVQTITIRPGDPEDKVVIRTLHPNTMSVYPTEMFPVHDSFVPWAKEFRRNYGK